MKVAPSILSADFANLKTEIQAVEKAGADWIHVDVMDGHFVDNITIGVPVVKSLRPVTKLPLDVHLMIENPEKYIDAFAKAGADYITFHIEATDTPTDVIKSIKKLGCKAGISLRPITPLETIKPVLQDLDLVLVMTVNPGFGGQSFMKDQIEKIDSLKQWREERGFEYLIEVDGGVSSETHKFCKNADVLVAGSYVFKNNYSEAISVLKGN